MNEKTYKLNYMIKVILVFATLSVVGLLYYAYEVIGGPDMDDEAFNIFIFATLIYIIAYALMKHDLVNQIKKYHIEIPKIIINSMYGLVGLSTVLLISEILMFIALVKQSDEYQVNVVIINVFLLIINIIFLLVVADNKKRLKKQEYTPFALPVEVNKIGKEKNSEILDVDR